jgi:subtilisin family serine protease
VHPRVRNLEPRLVDPVVSVEQEIEVERARPLLGHGRPVASEVALQVEQRLEKLPRRQLRLQLDGTVEEARLVDVPDGLGVAERGNADDLRPPHVPKPSHGRPEGPLPVAEIGAEADKRAHHETSVLRPSTLRALGRGLLIGAALVLASAAPARADLVQLRSDRGAGPASRAGGTELVRELRIWRIPADAVQRLRAAGLVRISRPERVFSTANALTQATDPLVPTEWWRPVIGADETDAPGPGKPVTVVDSGLDITHPEFATRANTVLMNRQTTTDQDEEHGTEVSSVVAAPNNGLGIVGVYPQAVLRMWDASPFGILNEGAAIQGIAAAAREGPGVINLSFGGEQDDPLLRDAVMFAYRSGSLVVAAAGNEGLDGSPKGFPAAYPHVLTVGASNEMNRVAPFSTIAPTVDLVAPGVSIPVAEPLAQNASGYSEVPGTSFSSPLVAGAAAWVWTVRPDLDNTQLFEIMRRSAVDIGVPGFDHASGYGLLNIPSALAYRTPARDPQEPNEDPAEIEPHGLFTTGTQPLTHPGHLSAYLSAHLDSSEDPVDLYRAWAPAHSVLHIHVVGEARVRLLPRFQRSVKTRPLAVGKDGAVAYRNGSSHGVFLYVELRPAARSVAYTLRLTAARR